MVRELKTKRGNLRLTTSMQQFIKKNNLSIQQVFEYGLQEAGYRSGHVTIKIKVVKDE